MGGPGWVATNDWLRTLTDVFGSTASKLSGTPALSMTWIAGPCSSVERVTVVASAATGTVSPAAIADAAIAPRTRRLQDIVYPLRIASPSGPTLTGCQVADHAVFKAAGSGRG